MHYHYFFYTFEPLYRRLTKIDEEACEVYFSLPAGNKELFDFMKKKVGRKYLLKNSYSFFLPCSLFISAEITGPDFPLKFYPIPKLQIYHGIGTAVLEKHKEVLRRFDHHFMVGPKWEKEMANLDLNAYPVGWMKTDPFIHPKTTLKEKRSPIVFLAKANKIAS